MLDLLTFIWEKVFLLAHLKLFSHLAAGPERQEQKRETRQCDRDRNGAPRYQRGDLLEVPRTLFIHFGIYLGENRVAHLIPDILPVLTSDKSQTQVMVTNTRLLLGVLSKNASIRVDSVEDFAYGGCILINAMDSTLQKCPLENEEVAQRAENLVGAIPYSLMWNNCEHFVTHCRYDTAVSLQTDEKCGVAKRHDTDRLMMNINTIPDRHDQYSLQLLVFLRSELADGAQSAALK
ncbi:lecithin retinol acyltransferase-like [Osmerus mordax]|uniref:lecithin retinol acyltransferase-like n=1 Tax=Osmerus mordax TaxID=8014 RepID=UPI00350F9BB5